MIHRRSPRCADDFPPGATDVPARSGVHALLKGALSKDLARDILNPSAIRAASGVANLANPWGEQQERHKAAAIHPRTEARSKLMSYLILLGNSLWRDMFWLAPPVAEKILRALIVYLFLIALLRVFGKRELAQLNPFDLVVLLTLSNTVQNAIIGDDNSVTGGLIGAMALVAANYLLVRFIFKHRRLDQLLAGRPTT